MRQLVLNQFEKIVSADINNLQLLMNKSLFDDTLYTLYGGSGVFAGSFKATYVSALAASLAAGTGFYYDSTQTGYNPNYRMILASSAIAVVFTAANTQDRIDLVCLAPNFAVAATATRFVKAGGVGPVAAQTVNKYKIDGYTLQVVAGTPGSSPARPSTPTGYIAIAACYIHANTGMASGSDITDLRAPLSGATAATVSASNSGHSYATGTTVQAQLDQLDAQLGSESSAANLSATTTITGTVTTTINQSYVTGIPTTVTAGMAVTCANFPTGTIVRYVNGSGVATFSKQATASTTGTPVAITFSHTFAVGTTVQKQLDQLDAAVNNVQSTVAAIQTITAAYSISAADAGKVLAVAATSAFDFQLPIPAALPNMEFTIVDTTGTFATYQIRLLPYGGESIVGLNSPYKLESGFFRGVFYNDGSNWFRRS